MSKVMRADFKGNVEDNFPPPLGGSVGGGPRAALRFLMLWLSLGFCSVSSLGGAESCSPAWSSFPLLMALMERRGWRAASRSSCSGLAPGTEAG